ncbi:MAG: BglG family transcription antiterminator [Clostridium sp.]
MRKKLIIQNLTESNPVSLKELVDKVKVSDRTIRNEIKDINLETLKNGFLIENIRGKGYILKITDSDKYKSYKESINEINSSYLIKGERINRIIEILLTNNGYITIDEISERLDYSRSTIIKDLEEVKRIIEELNLKLESKSSFGILVKGSEIGIRKAFSNYLYRHNSSISISKNKYKGVFFKVKEIFLKEVIKEKIDISNLAIENIFNHLQILILRLESENFIKEDTSNKDIIGEIDVYNKLRPISKRIFDLIENELNINIPRIEVDYLAAQILYKSKMFLQSDIVKTKVKKDIEEILKEIDKKAYTTFSSDYELINNLLMHLSALISRARTDTQLKNPYFDEVNTRYSAVVSIAVNFTDDFSKRWDMNIEKDEIAFIAIHFVAHFEKARQLKSNDRKKIAIICPTEGGLAYLLKLKLERELNESIISTFTSIQIDEMKKDNYSYIITSTEIEEVLNGKVYRINNLFSEVEIEDICKDIKRDDVKNENNKDMLDEVFFKRLSGGKNLDYKKFLKEEADMLLNTNSVNEDFFELVIKREKSLSTAYKNGVAGPHAMEMNALRNCLSITVFEESIDWGGKDINIICLICMKKGSLNLHKMIGSNLFKVINSKDLRDSILKCNDKKEFIKIFIDK